MNQQQQYEEFLRFERFRQENGKSIDNIVFLASTGVIAFIVYRFNELQTLQCLDKYLIVIAGVLSIISVLFNALSYFFAVKQGDYFIDDLRSPTDSNKEKIKILKKKVDLMNYCSYGSLILSVVSLFVFIVRHIF